jgi:hypothetical protein
MLNGALAMPPRAETPRAIVTKVCENRVWWAVCPSQQRSPSGKDLRWRLASRPNVRIVERGCRNSLHALAFG